jgi:hypothetical protein
MLHRCLRSSHAAVVHLLLHRLWVPSHHRARRSLPLMFLHSATHTSLSEHATGPIPVNADRTIATTVSLAAIAILTARTWEARRLGC